MLQLLNAGFRWQWGFQSGEELIAAPQSLLINGLFQVKFSCSQAARDSTKWFATRRSNYDWVILLAQPATIFTCW